MSSSIYAVGRNYAEHARELGNEVPQEPVIFCKAPGCLTRAKNIAFPGHLGPIHYELELVLEIGQAVPLGKMASLDCISRIGLGIDFTARELQSRLKQKGLPWELAKSFENACFLGDLAAFDAKAALPHFWLDRNGTRVQDGDPTLMLFPPLELLLFLNRNMALHPGDLVFTGTPKGVGPTTPGDLLEMEAPSLGLKSQVQIQ